MNGRYEESKTGPLGLGEAVSDSDGAARHFSDRGQILGAASTSSVAGGACGSIVGGSGLGSSLLQDRITAACEPSAINQAFAFMANEAMTIGQHIDRRIAVLQEQLRVMEGIRSQLASVGALDLPTQAMRDALY